MGLCVLVTPSGLQRLQDFFFHFFLTFLEILEKRLVALNRDSCLSGTEERAVGQTGRTALRFFGSKQSARRNTEAATQEAGDQPSPAATEGPIDEPFSLEIGALWLGLLLFFSSQSNCHWTERVLSWKRPSRPFYSNSFLHEETESQKLV